MAEQPLEAPADRAAAVRIPAVTPGPVAPAPLLFYHLTRPRPKVVVKRDLLPAICVMSLIPLFGLPLGWLWAHLAPAQNVVVQQNNQLVPVGNESYHRLDGLMIFVLIGLGAGVVTGIAVWMLRRRRGPVVMLAAVFGALGAAYLAHMTGVGTAGEIYAISAAPKIDDMVTRAPGIDSWWGLLAWPLGTALAYGCCAAWNGLDDLGRRLG